jgi:hypothetical protein
MPQPSPFPSAEFVDSVAAAIRHAVQELDRHESDLALLPGGLANPERSWGSALNQLEGRLGGWQQILSSMADEVRTAQEELGALDGDLKCALDMFSTARKHLQGSPGEAADASRA